MLTGANGQVGWELARSLLPIGEVVSLTRQQCDLSRPETLPCIVQEIEPDVVVNAAAYTAVDRAEEEEHLATIINGTAVGVLAEAARKRNALFIHYSTDYVFDGTKVGAYTEEDEPSPINAYGCSKLVGEEAVRHVGGDHLVFRTSWVYAARSNNFVRTILRLGKERDELKVVADQFGAPTSAELIADVTALVLSGIAMDPSQREKVSGTYHLTAAGRTSWYGYTKLIMEVAETNGYPLRVSSDKVIPINTDDFPRPAKRPLNSQLDTANLKSIFDIRIPLWEGYVRRCVTEIVL